MAGTLAVRMLPATTMPLGRRVRRWPAAVVTIAGNGGLGGEMVMMLEHMCRAEEPRETMVSSFANPGLRVRGWCRRRDCGMRRG